MHKKQLSQKEIIKMVQNSELSSQEGFTLIEELMKTNQGEATLYYKNIWEKSNEEPDLGSSALGNILIFGLPGQKLDIIKDQIIKQVDFSTIFVVNPGTKFEKQENNTYVIDPNNEADYRRLFQELAEHKRMPQTIVHQWSHQSFSIQETEIHSQLTNSIYSLFYISKALIGRSIVSRTNVLYVYPQSREDLMPQYAGVSGFAKSLMKENPNIFIKTVAIDSNSIKEYSDFLISEMQLAFDSIEVKYENDKRLVRHLKEFMPKAPLQDELPLQEYGVYVITGGTGGIGMLFAKYLAQKVKARLILVGRSQLNGEKEEQLEELRSLGAEVVYIQADISKREDVEKLIIETKSLFQVINGIIHSAGVTRDSFVLKKNQEEIEAVLASKVYGTIWLDEVTKFQNLDFFIMFSSIAAELGNTGQTDYAYANSFMDHFAERREDMKNMMMRSGKTLSINWPLWQEGGMRVDVHSQKLLSQISGLKSLNTKKGYQAFETILSEGDSQIMVLLGEKNKIDNIINLKQDKMQEELIDNKNNVKLSKINKNELLEKTAIYFRNVLSKETKVPAHKIRMEEPFEKYGIDSMIIINLTRELEKDFGKLSKTLFFEYQNLHDLSNYFAINYSQVLVEKLGISILDKADGKQMQNPIYEAKKEEKEEKGRGNKEINTMQEQGDIAIIGINGRYPMAQTLDEFWEVLKTGRDCITEIPGERWDYHKYYEPSQKKQGKTYSKWGGFIKDIDKFDPLFFNISPKEAEMMDPQERLFLETVWHTIEDAGYTRKRLEQDKIGVFVGVMYGQYQLYGADKEQQENGFIPTSSYASIANRVSYYFNFHGPSIAIDTMCSSSLTAIHLACTSIRKGESNLAIAGGVNVTAHPNKYLQLSAGNFTASDGRCRSFGEGGDGYVPGEGVGAVLLKSLDQAIEDGDYIYGIIKGSALNHGGKTNGYTVPNPNAQADLIKEAFKDANISPNIISYLEAHGTGTSLGDPIEITGLMKAFQDQTLKKQSCPIGSVKSNIGHLESAAGIAALTKVLLQMKHRQIVPSIHSERLNPNINFVESPFYVPSNLAEWKQPVVIEGNKPKKLPRIAGISSFGAGGANAHIIIQEYNNETVVVEKKEDPQLILLSAKNKERLVELASQLIYFLGDNNFINENYFDEVTIIEKLKKDIAQVVAEMMNICVEELDLEENVIEYALNPINLNRLAQSISQTYNIEVNPSIFSENSSVHVMTKQLFKEYKQVFADYYGLNIIKNMNVKKKHNLNFADIAYTLQIGREAMDERLALVASNIQELIDKLTQYCQGKNAIDSLYEGNVRDISRSADLFTGESGELFLRTITENKELVKLAELWLSDVQINWQSLYEVGVKRIHLPLYPFARERYWVPVIEKQGPIERLHPLIERNISTLSDIKFATKLYDSEEYVEDCMINNQKVLPALTALEMAFAAGNLVSKQTVRKVKDVVWGELLTLDKNALDMEINLYLNQDTVEFEVTSVDEEDIISVSTQGILSYQEQQKLAVEQLNIQGIKERCLHAYNKQEVYNLLQKHAITYGTNYQVIQELSLGKREAIARLEISEYQVDELADFMLHPALLEGILQCINGWMNQTGQTSYYLPYKVKEVEVMQRVTSKHFFVYVKCVENVADNSQAFHIKLLDEKGQMIIMMKHFIVRPMEVQTIKEYTEQGIIIDHLLSVEKLKKLVEQDIQKAAAKILKVNPERFDVNSEFDEFGFDSVGLKDYADQLSEIYRVDISPTVFFATSSIRRLTEHLLTEFEHEVRNYYEGSFEHGNNSKEKGKVIVNKSLPSLSKRYENRGRNRFGKNSEPIAIIGMSGTFPKSKDLNEFWAYLESETNLITEIPHDRWDWRDYHEDYVDGNIKTKSKWGGFVPDVDKFDPRFFKISPHEAEMMDPQQRMFIEIVWKTIEDSGYRSSDLSGRNIGIFAGVQFSDYQKMLASEGELNAQMGLGNEHSILVNRISYLFNFHGPSEPYNTACASAGTAIHRAVNSIRTGECEMAIAGGVCLNLAPYTMISSDQLGILSPDGKCKTLDKDANGYVKGEGVAAILLKPLSKAIEDHDNIHAVIRGTAVNHGGKATSLTAPNPQAQSALLVKAYEEANIDMETVGYLELHGTGTELGDPVEIEGIKNAFKQLSTNRRNPTTKQYYCGLGSVKTNIGHLEPASGIAGLLKVVLSMKHKKLPGMLHLNNVNPYVNIRNSPFYIVDKTQNWNRMKDEDGDEIPLRAGISSFGFGGANSHVVLEEYVRKSYVAELKEPKVFVLSAKNIERLKEYAQRIIQYLEQEFSEQPDQSFTDLIYTFQVGREEMTERLACVVSSVTELVDYLHNFVAGHIDMEKMYISNKQDVKKENISLNELGKTKIDIEELANGKEWDRIAKFWVRGGEIDWNLIYGEFKPHRMSLPTYPFSRERYWAPKDNKVNMISIKKKSKTIGKTKREEGGFFGVLSPLQSRIESEGIEEIAATEEVGLSKKSKEVDSNFLEELKVIFADILKLNKGEVHEDYNVEEYGVDSVISSIIVQRIQEKYSISIPLSAIAEYPTLNELTQFVEGIVISEGGVSRNSPMKPKRKVTFTKPIENTMKKQKLPPELIPLNATGAYQNAFFVHGGPGLAAFYNNLSKTLGNDYPVYVFQAKGVDGKTMPRNFEEMVSHYMHCIRMVQPKGPYVIGGYSFGGIIAFEMAQRFMRQGEEVSKLIIFDTFPPDPEANEIFYSNSDPNNAFFKLMMGNEFANARKNKAALILPKDLQGIHPFLHISHIAQLAKQRGGNPLPVEEIYNFITGACRLNDYAGATYDTYKPQAYYGDVLYFKATDGFVGEDNWMGLDPVNVYKDYDYTGPWRKWVKGDMDIIQVPCDHFNILEEPSLSIVKRFIQASLYLKTEIEY
ncbi:SDR family NAD(P)-dependent oxidoreductase [Bacillus sp. DX4.1]|uniref:SDR family NAD(P)-dependent oxidoreductase n=1 Tax=Bacillus sp. DX4.1 TaxID=3055867 RepID=UPI0025A0CE58|nr:SDR family NAD(P)-dependent oxidoreductase [Bacillus sp. DX4.1]MDM5187019.1 SDR family NAD(P)-dependent oxidoreductase [Bacillus sp. DX4.1]